MKRARHRRAGGCAAATVTPNDQHNAELWATGKRSLTGIRLSAGLGAETEKRNESRGNEAAAG